jgi:hypothetical protein
MGLWSLVVALLRRLVWIWELIAMGWAMGIRLVGMTGIMVPYRLASIPRNLLHYIPRVPPPEPLNHLHTV